MALQYAKDASAKVDESASIIVKNAQKIQIVQKKMLQLAANLIGADVDVENMTSLKSVYSELNKLKAREAENQERRDRGEKDVPPPYKPFTGSIITDLMAAYLATKYGTKGLGVAGKAVIKKVAVSDA